MTHILLTNDDGYQAEGLRTLARAFESFATVSIVAPSREQSGAAQSLTLRQPIVCNRVGEREWAIDGTPADCVIVALHKLLPERPDMVISGINHGANLGENVYYSGTVGAAREERCTTFRRLQCRSARRRATCDLKIPRWWQGRPQNLF
jgi:5'-nucleotidase